MDVQGLQLTKAGVSPSVSSTSLVISLVVLVLLYVVLAIVDLMLMLRYSRKELAPPRAADAKDTPSLKVMTVAAVVLLPEVLGYQTWTYYVFRRRISDRAFEPAAASPTPGGVGKPPEMSNRPRTDQQEELR